MRIRIIILFFIVELFFSCHGDYHELSGKYVYCEYTIAKLPSNSRWTAEGKYIPDKVIISRMVTNYNHDNDYIIAHQVTNSHHGEVHSYWIIRLSDDMIWGPLQKDSFDIKCKEQNVKIYLDPKYESDL